MSREEIMEAIGDWMGKHGHAPPGRYRDIHATFNEDSQSATIEMPLEPDEEVPA